jgi:hypothetical protein
MLPYGNILVGFWRMSMKCSRTGIFSQKADKKQEMLPYGNIIEIGGWGRKSYATSREMVTNPCNVHYYERYGNHLHAHRSPSPARSGVQPRTPRRWPT